METRDEKYSECRARRVALGLTQRELAKRVGCSHMSISLIERGLMLEGGVVRYVTRVLLDLEATAEGGR